MRKPAQMADEEPLYVVKLMTVEGYSVGGWHLKMVDATNSNEHHPTLAYTLEQGQAVVEQMSKLHDHCTYALVPIEGLPMQAKARVRYA